MSGRWWRAYEGAAHDPKIQTLPAWVFKLWFNLLCLASANDGVIPAIRELRSVHPWSTQRLNLGIKILLDRGLIDQIEGRLEPHNWRKRQYKDDVSTPRVQKHRAKMKRVSETAPETETETETETDRVSEDTNSRARSLFSDFWKAFPQRHGDNPKGKAEAKFTALVEAGADPAVLIAAARRYAELNRETEPRFIPMAFTWLNEQRWQETKPQLELPTISPGQPEWDAWMQYYREEKKSLPLAMQRVLDGQQKAMTVPARWPEETDSGYAAAIELKRKLDEKAS